MKLIFLCPNNYFEQRIGDYQNIVSMESFNRFSIEQHLLLAIDRNDLETIKQFSYPETVNSINNLQEEQPIDKLFWYLVKNYVLNDMITQIS